jgi:hypothetical protein
LSQASEDIDEINHPEKLSIEATMINQNFSQQVLKEKDANTRKQFEPNPFFEEDNSGILIYLCIYVYMYLYLYMYVYISIYICIYTYVYMYI